MDIALIIILLVMCLMYLRIAVLERAVVALIKGVHLLTAREHVLVLLKLSHRDHGGLPGEVGPEVEEGLRRGVKRRGQEEGSREGVKRRSMASLGCLTTDRCSK